MGGGSCEWRSEEDVGIQNKCRLDAEEKAHPVGGCSKENRRCAKSSMGQAESCGEAVFVSAVPKPYPYRLFHNCIHRYFVFMLSFALTAAK